MKLDENSAKVLDERAAKMRELLDRHVAQLKTADAAAARDTAFEMLQVLNGLYQAAYVAAAQLARQQGNRG